MQRAMCPLVQVVYYNIWGASALLIFSRWDWVYKYERGEIMNNVVVYVLPDNTLVEVSSVNPLPVTSTGIGGTGTITRPTNTNTYTALDVIGTAVTSTMAISLDPTLIGSHYIIMGASLRIDLSAVPASMGAFNLHLFSAAPTAIVDEGAFNLIAADRAKYLGAIAFDALTDLGDTLYTNKENINMKRKLADDSNTIYGVLQTVGALVGASGTVFTVKLHAVQA
jgi:hypothetical protein